MIITASRMLKSHLWGSDWFQSVTPHLCPSSSLAEACSEPEAMAPAHTGNILLLLLLSWQQLCTQLVKWLRTSRWPSVSLCLNPLMQLGSICRASRWRRLLSSPFACAIALAEFLHGVGILASHLCIWLASFSHELTVQLPAKWCLG